jgi:hypothetical protein
VGLLMVGTYLNQCAGNTVLKISTTQLIRNRNMINEIRVYIKMENTAINFTAKIPTLG